MQRVSRVSPSTDREPGGDDGPEEGKVGSGERSLSLVVSPIVRAGQMITAQIRVVNVAEVVVEIGAPDTVVISEPRSQLLAGGTYSRTLEWRVEHAQHGSIVMVEVSVTAGTLFQTALCRVVA